MANPRRIEKINVLTREVIADIVLREMQFPAGVLVTVTRVETSEDLQYADVFVSILGGSESSEKEILDQLSKAAGFIQGKLNRKLRMRPVPRITFAVDEEEKKRERVEKLLAEDENRV